MTKKERAGLEALCRKWRDHHEYSDDYERAGGIEDGYYFAAYDLEDWLSR